MEENNNYGYAVACMHAHVHMRMHAAFVHLHACTQHLHTFAGVCVLAWHAHLMLACSLHLYNVSSH